jgi:hypothetical protein
LTCLRLEVATLHDVFDECRELDRLRLTRCGIAFGARHLDQRFDQRRQPIDFLLYACECLLAISGGPRQLNREMQAREWRTQFMRDILEQSSFGRHQRLDAFGHSVEGAREVAHFIAARRRYPGCEIAAAEAIDRAGELPDGPDDGQRNQPAQEHDGGQNEHVVRHERPHVEWRRRQNE